MTTKTNTLLTIQSICDQRRNQMLYNVPPSRINVISPYENTKYTKFDLDMRRKAQVLKYQVGSTKGNMMTKKQQWSRIANGNYQRQPSSYLTTITKYENNAVKIVDCSATGLILTPLSASNVPPDPSVSFLYNDESVPLYNYLNPISTRAYNAFENAAIINSDFQTIILYNTTCESNIPNRISGILFSNSIDENAYTINIHNIPLAIHIQGILNGIDIYDINANTITINSIHLSTYFNQNLVPDRSIYQYVYSPSNLLQNYYLDISTNVIQSGDTFKAIQYIGTVSIYNILLYTEPGFSYDFKLDVNLSYFPSKNDDIPSMHASIIANVTPDKIVSYACTIEPVLSSTTIPTMYISQ